MVGEIVLAKINFAYCDFNNRYNTNNNNKVMIISQAWYKADLFPVVLSSRAAWDCKV